MSNYTKATDFATKDTLPSGDTGKIVKGSEIDAEFVAIQTAVNSKADTNGNTFTGDVSFGDNVKAKFGTGNDLEIYHDGSNSIIKDNGTGILKYTSNVSQSLGTVLEIENTNTSSGTGAYVKFLGANQVSADTAPSIGTFYDTLIIRSNNKISATFGSISTSYNSLLMYDNNNVDGGSITTGAGSPEGVVSAKKGSLYMRTDGGSGTSLYVKESGTGTSTTGWVAK